MTNQELSIKILELVGGKDNAVTAANCMTRLRIQLRDSSLADIPALKQTPGVLGVVEDATLQIILGPGKAKKVCDIFVVDAQVQTGDSANATQSMSTDNDWETNKAAMKAGADRLWHRLYLYPQSALLPVRRSLPHLLRHLHRHQRRQGLWCHSRPGRYHRRRLHRRPDCDHFHGSGPV